MSSDIAEKAKKILTNNEYLKEFAGLNQMTTEAAKALLERLMREPTVSEQVEKFVFSEQTSPDLKGYYSGEEKGYNRGHEAGFAKGAAIGVLGTLSAIALGAVALIAKSKD